MGAKLSLHGAALKPLFISIPHSGEAVPEEVSWLKGLPEQILMCDVDRYVDQLYHPIVEKLKIPTLISKWHRYVVDLNRSPEDVDQASVIGSLNPVGTHPKGYHWSITTLENALMPQPMSKKLHEQLTERYYTPFHQSVESQIAQLHSQGAPMVFHIDAHSMPSKGTKLHRDNGQRRKDIVISDQNGKSCSKEFKDLVFKAYQDAGFDCGYNWPYVGGFITQKYGKPERGCQTIQVELNRALYMDETTKILLRNKAEQTSQKIGMAVSNIFEKLESVT